MVCRTYRAAHTCITAGSTCQTGQWLLSRNVTLVFRVRQRQYARQTRRWLVRRDRGITRWAELKLDGDLSRKITLIAIVSTAWAHHSGAANGLCTEISSDFLQSILVQFWIYRHCFQEKSMIFTLGNCLQFFQEFFHNTPQLGQFMVHILDN